MQRGSCAHDCPERWIAAAPAAAATVVVAVADGGAAGADGSSSGQADGSSGSRGAADRPVEPDLSAEGRGVAGAADIVVADRAALPRRGSGSGQGRTMQTAFVANPKARVLQRRCRPEQVALKACAANHQPHSPTVAVLAQVEVASAAAKTQAAEDVLAAPITAVADPPHAWRWLR